MTGYLVRRILLCIPILLAVLTLVFLLVRVAPGDPAVAALGDYASKEAVEALREKMGLNAPLYVQYFQFLSGLLHGDLGKSLITSRPVAAQVASAFPYTLELTASGILLGSFLGIPLGIFTALHRNAMFDYLGRLFSLVGLSVPAFYLGILLILLFAIKLELFPVVGGGNLSDLGETLRYLFLPALTLALIMMSYITRMTRSSVLDILNEDYVRTARAKGLRERLVVYKHVLKNALLPILSVIGMFAIVLIGSSVMTEVVFSRPGLGKMLVGAMKQRDYIMLQSIMVIFSSLVVLINLLTDLAYGFIDPRIRYE
ncbi:MAG: ABC transporter permease [Candidatus Bipolaricaulota bacterium]|nr:ABC transporter permease [Candidatus Bipolaricaulota bacterium]